VRNDNGERADVGETLIEILLTVVIVGLTFTALFSSLSGAGAAGNAQRNSVQADIVMRNYAEATKAAVESCVLGGTYTVAPPLPLPPRFTASTTVVGVVGASGVVAVGTCPPVATPQLLLLTVTTPLGSPLTMQIRVSTP